jgi:NADH-quinone oxidoreductase subunit I
VKGIGLIKGLKTTLRYFFRPNVTVMYPEERPNLSDRFHGELEIDMNKCIACGLCTRACPNKVISLEVVKDEETKKRRLDGYFLDLGYCLFCGLCTEACPTKAIHFSQRFELACYTREQVPVSQKRGEQA